MSVRIIGGRFKGRKLATPAGEATRPTADRVREALFSILGPLDGLHVLDIFAGSGALGFEALSRGAASVAFVESAKPALAVIAANIAALDVRSQARAIAGDWEAALDRERLRGAVVDLVLADPPYADTQGVAPRLGVVLADLLRAGGRVVLEYSSDEPEPPALGSLKVAGRTDRRYGATTIAIIEHDK